MSKCDRWPSVLDENGLQNNENVILLGAKPNGKETTLSKTPTIEFYNPREKQRTIAKGRDFYVTGKFCGIGVIPDDATLVVNIFKKNEDGSVGNIVRSVFCQKKDDIEHLYVEDEYKLLRPFNTEERGEKLSELFKMTVKGSCIPDLVYDKVDDEIISKKDFNKELGPASLQWPWNKAYYTDTFFSALIYGGEFGHTIEKEVERINREKEKEAKLYNKPFEPYVRPFPYTKDGAVDHLGNKHGNENPREIECMEEKDYIVQVSVYAKESIGTNNPYGFTSNDYIVRGNLDIKIGTINDKIMSTFSYKENVDRLKEIEKKENWTLLWDPFPGIWLSTIITDEELTLRPNNHFPTIRVFEIETDRARANFNDAVEYRKGNIRFFDYGVMEWSNTLIAEFPELINREEGYAQNLFTYYYDNGVPYDNGCANDYHLLKQEVKYLYAEIDGEGILKEGVCDRNWSEKARRIEKIPLDTTNIRVKPGYKVGISGVCRVPEVQHLQKRDEELAYRHIDLWNSFLYQAPKNSIGISKKGKLKRNYDGKQDDKSQEKSKIGVLEFKHVFSVPKEWAGRHIKIVATAAYSTAPQRLQIGTAIDGETVFEFDVEK